jgi:hypothetical protein
MGVARRQVTHRWLQPGTQSLILIAIIQSSSAVPVAIPPCKGKYVALAQCQPPLMIRRCCNAITQMWFQLTWPIPEFRNWNFSAEHTLA